MENKLRITRPEDEVYRINISDDGKEIVFDLLDVELPYRINKAYVEVEKNMNTCKGAIEAIKKKHKDDAKPEMVGQMTREQLEIENEYRKMYQKDRTVMDNLLGQGTMEALFGEHNYLTMFEDLFDALEPHLEKIHVNVDAVTARMQKKYGVKDSDTLK